MNQLSKTNCLYLFYGEESYLIQQRVKRIVDSLLSPAEHDFNLVLLEADPTVPELIQLVESAPFFGQNKVVVVKNSRLFQAARRKTADLATADSEAEAGGGANEDGKDVGDPRLLDLFSRMPAYTTLVFTASKADKRRKLVKVVAEHGQVQELNPFRPLEEREIRNWVETAAADLGKRVQRDAMDHLLAVTGTMQQISRSFLAGELEKAALFAGTDPVIGKACLEAVMAAMPEVSAFAMTEALARRDVAQALARLEELFANREPPLKIIGLLAFKVRQWWQVRQVLDRRGSEAELLLLFGPQGGRSGMARRIIAQGRSFRSNALKHSLVALADANAAIRSGTDPKLYLEKVIIDLCS